MIQSSQPQIGFQNGKFVSIQELSLTVDNIAVNRGYGAFDFFGVINKKAFYLDRHLDRFFRTMEILRLTIDHNKSNVRNLIELVIQQNQASDYYIKLFALPLASDVTPILQCELFIIPVTIGAYDEMIFKTGGILITKEYARFLPEAKSTNYLPMVYWNPEILNSGAIDVLYYQNNQIHETSRGNIFIIKNNSIYTPSENILKGITRSVVINILNDSNLEFFERPITLNEFLDADEVFLTSTTKKVLPIVKVDSKMIGAGIVGKVTQKIMNSFDEIQKNWAK